MEKGQEQKLQELRLRFEKLAEELEHLRGEWIEAHTRRDADREGQVINDETRLFAEVSDIVAEFTSLVRTRT